MDNRKLVIIYIAYLAPYLVGNGLISLLPLYAVQLGASAGITGTYLAISFAALAIGSRVAGTISNHFGVRKPFVIGGLMGSGITIYAMGQVQTVLMLTLVTALGWFFAGLVTSMILILTGLLAESGSSGRTFGIVGTALPLGQLIGGFVAGPVVDRWGFGVLFTMMSLVYILPILLTFFLVDPRTERKQKIKRDASAPTRVNRIFWMIFFAAMLAYVTTFTGNLLRPILMEGQGFNNSAISIAVGIAGGLNLPMPFLLGWLSDRSGKQALLMLCYLIGAVGMSLLVVATSLWMFWLSLILVTVMNSGFVLSSALISDTSAPDELDSNLSMIATAPWIGGVLGYALAGVVAATIGQTLAVLVFAFAPLLGFALITRLGAQRKRVAAIA